jgi:hypothetical protein
VNIAEALRGLLAAAVSYRGRHMCIDASCDGRAMGMTDCSPGCRHKAAVDALAARDAGIAELREAMRRGEN